MKRLKEFLLSRDFVLCTLVAMGIRAMIVEPGMGFACTALAFAALVGYDKYIAHNAKVDTNAEMQEKLDVLQNHVSGLMMKNATRPAQMNNELKRLF